MVYKTKRSDLRVQNYEVENFKKNGYAGKHILADFWFGKKIEKKEKLERILLAAAKKAKSNPLGINIYQFEPQGLTGVVLLSESHIAIHTWPEIGYIAIDIFTCGTESMPNKALDFLRKEISPKKEKIKEIKRGEEL
ncbi:MAG: adenosylmethionine decarboxylase [Candidatus Paceibacterota bacterium]|jgi:S-adenosylmethionine decarboxylase|nr:adenosylmethionine decarboxylase [Candidatus Paceibacterota bacterium]MDD3072768.1 adenosylmethionine decarboxylase [Candidatus Paceibacterota bacterium]MDD3729116.1 adenosylmethionine decarboxylase [Candidatus Paceibacterota bacterium]MDD4201232.1 adenosylmethionine decarboxylase [Candidatus Paceibacterota bacterium]MDD4467325.1 adenosylmethionine decarboxylase [Candidatus Paceibacterota bacterium]